MSIDNRRQYPRSETDHPASSLPRHHADGLPYPQLFQRRALSGEQQLRFPHSGDYNRTQTGWSQHQTCTDRDSQNEERRGAFQQLYASPTYAKPALALLICNRIQNFFNTLRLARNTLRIIESL